MEKLGTGACKWWIWTSCPGQRQLPGAGSLGPSAPGFSCLRVLPSSRTSDCRPVTSLVNLGSGAARSLHGSLTFTLGTEPPSRVCAGTCSLPQARGVPGRRFGSPGRGARTSEGGSSRGPGPASAALKTFQRACHGDAQRPSRTDPRGRASRGELSASRRRVTLAFRRASPWAALRPPARPPAPSLLARTVPAPPPLWARSARPGRWRRRPSPPPPPRSPARRSSEWPSPVPRPDCRRASAAPAPGGWERSGAGREEGTRREGPEEAAGADFSPMVRSDMSKSPPSAAAAVAQELPMDVLESAAPAGALGAPAQVATAPRLRLPL